MQNKREILMDLKKYNINIKKKYGQNFLIDQNILSKIVDTAELDSTIAVIEIGGGVGSLTDKLCQKAGYVLCYEIDSELIPILRQNLKEYSNYEIINQDILKVDIQQEIKDKLSSFSKIYVVANLPYYITTPILLNLLEKTDRIQRYILMMQEEVAERICGIPKTKEYNALSIAVQYRCKATKEFKVGRNVFLPEPNVDSAVVKLEMYREKKYMVEDETSFFGFVRQCFSQRRKTLVNNLCKEYDKTIISEALIQNGLSLDIRSEELSIEEFIKIFEYITK